MFLNVEHSSLLQKKDKLRPKKFSHIMLWDQCYKTFLSTIYKHSSLLGKFLNYGQKSFARLTYKLSFLFCTDNKKNCNKN